MADLLRETGIRNDPTFDIPQHQVRLMHNFRKYFDLIMDYIFTFLPDYDSSNQGHTRGQTHAITNDPECKWMPDDGGRSCLKWAGRATSLALSQVCNLFCHGSSVAPLRKEGEEGFLRGVKC